MPTYQSLANALVELDPATGEALLKTTPSAPAAGAATEAKQDVQITAEQAIQAAVENIPANNAVFVCKVKTVPVAGTAETLGPQLCGTGKGTTVRALKSNTGSVFIGNSKVAAETAATAFELEPGESLELLITNWSEIWIDPAVNGEGVNAVVEA